MVVPSAVNNGGDAGDGLLEVDGAAGSEADISVVWRCRMTQLMTLFLMIKMALLLRPSGGNAGRLFKKI